MKKIAATFCLTFALALAAADRSGDWTGDYAPCDRHDEVLNRGRLDLGVRFSTGDRELAAEFARAMDFWATVLDMDWHVEEGRHCAIQLIDGDPGLFKPAESARSQFPGAASFQGWIAFNPRPLPAGEMFLTAVHEIGHLLGLSHSRNPSSIMYFLSLEGPVSLDSDDLAALSARHRLRTSAGPIAARIIPPCCGAAEQ